MKRSGMSKETFKNKLQHWTADLILVRSCVYPNTESEKVRKLHLHCDSAQQLGHLLAIFSVAHIANGLPAQKEQAGHWKSCSDNFVDEINYLNFQVDKGPGLSIGAFFLRAVPKPIQQEDFKF
jgi:hypothetical protein